MSQQDSAVMRNMYLMAVGLGVFLAAAITLARVIVY